MDKGGYMSPEINFIDIACEAGICVSNGAFHSGFEQDDSYYDGWEE